MQDTAPALHPETLAKFEALEKVRDLRPRQPEDAEKPRVDTSGLLPVVDPVAAFSQDASPAPVRTPLVLPRAATEQPAGPASPQGYSAGPRAPFWYDRPTVLFALGLAGVLAAAMVAYIIRALLGDA